MLITTLANCPTRHQQGKLHVVLTRYRLWTFHASQRIIWNLYFRKNATERSTASACLMTVKEQWSNLNKNEVFAPSLYTYKLLPGFKNWIERHISTGRYSDYYMYLEQRHMTFISHHENVQYWQSLFTYLNWDKAYLVILL